MDECGLQVREIQDVNQTSSMVNTSNRMNGGVKCATPSTREWVWETSQTWLTYVKTVNQVKKTWLR